MADPIRLAKYIKDSGLSYKENSKSYIFTCPICSRKEKLYIRKRDGKFACWYCRETQGFQGAPEFALAELLGLTVPVVKKGLYGNLSEAASTFIDIKFYDLVDEDDEEFLEVEEETVLQPLAFPYHCIPLTLPGAAKGVKYLASRDIPLDIANMYGIRYSPEKEAIVFPIIVDSQLVGWQYRTINKTEELLEDNTILTRTKAWSSKDIPRDRVFMFQDNLRNSSHAVLCEGPLDAIRAHYVGGNICAMGKAITQSQVNRLLRSGVGKVYIALDPDAFAELTPLLDKFTNVVEILKVDIPITNSKPDLGALTFEQAERCIKAAKPLMRNQLFPWLKPLPNAPLHATILGH